MASSQGQFHAGYATDDDNDDRNHRFSTSNRPAVVGTARRQPALSSSFISSSNPSQHLDQGYLFPRALDIVQSERQRLLPRDKSSPQSSTTTSTAQSQDEDVHQVSIQASKQLQKDRRSYTAVAESSREPIDAEAPIQETVWQQSAVLTEHNYIPSFRRQQGVLAPISIPSFTAFRSQTSAIPLSARAGHHRTIHSPKSASVSWIPISISPRLITPAVRPVSIDSPQSAYPSTPRLAVPPSPAVGPSSPLSTTSPQPPSRWLHDRTASIDTRLVAIKPLGGRTQIQRQSSIPIHNQYLNDQRNQHTSMPSISSMDSYSVYSSVNGQVVNNNKDVRAPDLKLHLDGVQRTLSNGSQISDASTNSREAKSAAPVSKFGSFFGWKSTARSGAESPTTTFSDRSPSSPLPSPHMEKPLPKSPSGARLTPPLLELARTNSNVVDAQSLPWLFGDAQSNAHVQDLEQELSHISTELASSIRREMELEDELERIRAELPNPALSDLNRRGSDYFSDSGASSARYPITNIDGRIEQLEAKLRKVEQEKGLMKNEMATRIQAELARRKELEETLQDVENRLDRQPALQGQTQRSEQADSRVKELELTLEEARRRFNKERAEKDNFEELYSATKLELARYRNERDNLRDEIVPALRARVEGLEAQSAETEALVYENTRMQQELAALRGGSETPRMAQARFAIAEEGGARNVSRSNSMAKRGGSMARSGSVKGEGRGRSGSIGAPVTAEGFKEMEDQRDALHKALKLLINRHEKQQKDHKRAIDQMSRARVLADSLVLSRRSPYYKEVAFLKEEVTTLRKRTEDALEQKWQYEKGLGGLKMDLDRAEQETRSLRELLRQHDVIPRSRSNSGQEDSDAEHAEMELSISKLEKERDGMRRMAQDYRQQASSGPSAEADGLLQAATRIEQLANQLDEEVKSNKDLRERLAQAVAKGEQEQKNSTRQIEVMQRRLADLEASVLAAQQHSESTLVNHETESRRIEEATSPMLQRLVVTAPESSKLPPTSPLRTPKSERARRSSQVSLLESGRTQMLERKVRELENSLREAEGDMQMVVQRVNRSQLEVADLQTERDQALSQMRKLQRAILAEKENAKALASAQA